MSFIKALKCQNTSDTPPIWLMRQAGRYLPQYRDLRKKISLVEMFHDPEAIVKVTKMPFKQFAFDAAILFSDILIILDAFGFKWDFKEGHGPVVECDLGDISSLRKRAAEETYPQIETAIKELKRDLHVPLVGFAGGPFTIASYLLERTSARSLTETKKWSLENPEKLHALLEKITEATIEYLFLQIKAGVDAIQIFDSWAGISTLFDQFSLPYLKKITEALRPEGLPIILFTRGSCRRASQLAALSPTAISLDWEEEIATVRKKIHHPIALQGNLDPEMLLKSKKELGAKVDQIMGSMAKDSGFIFNLGHGILPETPLENVHFLLEKVKG